MKDQWRPIPPALQALLFIDTSPRRTALLIRLQTLRVRPYSVPSLRLGALRVFVNASGSPRGALGFCVGHWRSVSVSPLPYTLGQLGSPLAMDFYNARDGMAECYSEEAVG